MFQFLLDQKDLEKTVVQKRIEEVLLLEEKKKTAYPLDEAKLISVKNSDK